MSSARERANISSSSIEKVEEEHWREIEAPGWGEDDNPPQTRTRFPYVEVVRSGTGRPAVYGLYRVGEAIRRSLDPTAGLRAYTGTTTVCYGFYALAGIPMLVGEPAEIEVLPADVQEYDGAPALAASLSEAFGTLPPIVSGDRGMFTRQFHEFWLRHGTSVVTATKKKVGQSLIKTWRTGAYDEHGVVRCPVCGGPGNAAWPGLGLTIVRGEPVIKARCMLRLDARCGDSFTVPCKHEWLLLRGLSPLHELAHAIAARHSTLEASFRHNRQRFSIAGKELPDCVARAGLPAQRLRIQAALLLTWARLGLRNGWIAPQLLEVEPNDVRPVLLSARQDRRSLELLEPGIGTPRLARLLAQRQQRGLGAPYGAAYAAQQAATISDLRSGDGR